MKTYLIDFIVGMDEGCDCGVKLLFNYRIHTTDFLPWNYAVNFKVEAGRNAIDVIEMDVSDVGDYDDIDWVTK